MKKTLCLIAVLLMLIPVLTGCGGPAEYTFEKENFSITLTDDFKEISNSPYTYYFVAGSDTETTSDDLAVMIARDPLGAFADGQTEIQLTPEEYAQQFLEKNYLEIPVRVDELDNVCFSYTPAILNRQYLYYGTVKCAEDAYWLCQFVCCREDAKTYGDKFMEWAASIKLFTPTASSETTASGELTASSETMASEEPSAPSEAAESTDGESEQ